MSPTETLRSQAVETFKRMQDDICTALEHADGGATFKSDRWERPDLTGAHGGGGHTRVISNGNVIEKGGVNFSEVHGVLPKEMSMTLIGLAEESPFFAAGTSLVIHPYSPQIPTIHANVRYFEVRDRAWFGGGIDLTPYILYEEDCVHFHRGLKQICDKHDHEYYPKFKKQCDEYFYLPHRGETRGIGGIFFDYLGKETNQGAVHFKNFVFDVAQAFNELYIPIIERRKNTPFTEQQKNFQLVRRGRYVEFNLVYDRGTLFGLKTGGRTESILMSLPLHAKWEYSYEPTVGSDEEKITGLFKSPRDWV